MNEEAKLLLVEERERKSQAVKSMIEMLNAQEISDSYVMLLRYYIEAEAFGASALTVSREHTPNLKETANGFVCDTFFPPDMLTSTVKLGKPMINGVIKVQVEVKLEDITAIFATTKGEREITLYES